jgi:hypothetical protein
MEKLNYALLRHAHPSVVLTYHLTLPRDVLHHLYNRCMVNVPGTVCSDTVLRQCQAVDR